MSRLYQLTLLVGLSLPALFLVAGCQSVAPPPPAAPGTPKVLALESFLGDMAQQVGGDRIQVDTLMPLGLDPHAFEPTPQDVARIADSTIIIANGAGVEPWLEKVLANAGGQHQVIEAAATLPSRPVAAHDEAGSDEHDHGDIDPHFWLDPTKVVAYVAAIRDGLTAADPGGKDTYARNAQAYSDQLAALDTWIAAQIAQIPEARRILVTNHESLGYFADRYGLHVVGAIVPSVSTGSSPSAQELAHLADTIRQTGAPAIFLETGANAQLAQQLGQETGVKVITDLYTHSLSPAGGPAPTYLDMMRYNTEKIVAALK